jgi:hypothetical protein
LKVCGFSIACRRASISSGEGSESILLPEAEEGKGLFEEEGEGGCLPN